MLLIGSLLIPAAWWLVILSMEQHGPVLLGRMLSRPMSRAVRAVAICAMLASLVLFAGELGWQQGPVFWSMALMIAALLTALCLTLLQRGRTGRRPPPR